MSMSYARRRVGFALLLVLTMVLATLLAVAWFLPMPVGSKKLLLDFMLGRGIASPTAAVIDARLVVPQGFALSAWARDVPLARTILSTSGGDLIVSRTRADEVVLLERDLDNDGKSDGQRVLLPRLNGPFGLALYDGWLYVAERDGIGRARFDPASGRVTSPYQRILSGLTSDGFHQTKSIRFGPDGWLYLAQGSTCNVCVEKDPRRATIMRMQPDGSQASIYATGLRNSVGLDWNPWDGGLYATENGRDLLGDDSPPDELNLIQSAKFYGWPYVHGNDILDPDMGKSEQGRLLATTRPAHAFRAHNAPLGLKFLDPNRLPAQYQRTALVALHGSWNRRTPDGYKVVALHWQPDGSIVERDFLTGFLNEHGVIGRPVGVEQATDGSIFISDDYAGVIYRVAYRGQ
jgi:glucose/arabinose dehydrogenase